MKRRLLIAILLLLFSLFLFAGGGQEPDPGQEVETSKTYTYSLVLDPGGVGEVRGGFCSGSSYGVPLAFNKSFTTIDGIALTAVHDEAHGTITFSGNAAIAVQINSLLDVKMSVKGKNLFTKGDPISQKITIQGTQGTAGSIIKDGQIQCSIPDGNKALISEYMRMDMKIVYSDSIIKGDLGALKNILSDFMTLTLVYTVK